MGFMDTALGAYLNKVTKLTEQSVKQFAYSDNVLAQMADLNNEQLDEGLYADGSDTQDYAPTTSQIKREKGQQSEWMTFKDTGETRESIEYVYNGNLRAVMNDKYDLLTNYSRSILGLTQESISDVQEEIKENIREQFKP